MIPVISVDLMRESDAYTIENLIPSKELMYKAGKAVFDVASPAHNSIIVCGTGNNAGDGYVIALEMAKAGLKATLLLLEDRFSPDGLYYFEKCKEAGIGHMYATAQSDLSPYSDIVDCIFGTGFRGEPQGMAACIIDKINASGKRVISVDINSGLSGDSGLYSKCVMSDLTVSVGYLKTGFFMGKASKTMKKLVNVDIGIELTRKPYELINNIKDLPLPYSIYGKSNVNSIEELKSKADGSFLRWQNVLTDGHTTYILAGDTPYEH